MISKDEALKLAEKKRKAKADVIDEWKDNKYLVGFGFEGFASVNKETGEVKDVRIEELL